MQQQTILSKRKKTSEAGFSLIDSMIAISIFSICTLAVIALQTSAVSGNRTARLISDEMVEAEEKLEELMALAVIDPDNSDLSETAGTPHTDTNVEEGYDRSWIVILEDPNFDGTNDYRRIAVTVLHKNDSNRTATVQCYLPLN